MTDIAAYAGEVPGRNRPKYMKVMVEQIDSQQEEQVLIRCHRVTETVRDIRHFILSRQENLEGYEAGKLYRIPLPEIYYAEAVDNRLFVYTKHKVYEVKMKLYAFEEAYKSKQFFRCSRTVVVNLMRIDSLRPALNGRLSARLHNGEDIIISRKYVNSLRDILRGGERGGNE